MNSLTLASRAQSARDLTVLIYFALPNLIPDYPTTILPTFSLRFELQTLSSSLHYIREGLYHHDLSEFAMVQHDLWRHIDAAFSCCCTTLHELITVFPRPQDIRINVDAHKTAVVAIRDKMFLSNCALEIIVTIIIISFQITHGCHDSFVDELNRLKATINTAYYASSRPIGGFSSDNPDFSMRHEMLCLIHEAWHFYSSVVHVSGLQTTTPLTHNQPVPFIPAFLPGIEPETFPSSPWVEHTDYERFLRRYPRAVLESTTLDIRNGNYARAIQSIAHLWSVQPKPGRLLVFPECRLLCAQLALCHFLQGDPESAHYQVMTLVDAMTDQDLIACTLLHALALAHFSGGRLTEAKAICSTAVVWKRVLCMVCKINRAEWYEYRESLAFRATMFEFEGDYAQAETYWKMLPQSFVYKHPLNPVEYLQSKSDILGPLIGHQPQQTIEATTPIYQSAEDGCAPSLRQAALDYQQTEVAIMNELLICRSAEQLSANETDNDVPHMATNDFHVFQPPKQQTRPIFSGPSRMDILYDDESSDEEPPSPSVARRKRAWPSDETGSIIRSPADQSHLPHAFNSNSSDKQGFAAEMSSDSDAEPMDEKSGFPSMGRPLCKCNKIAFKVDISTLTDIAPNMPFGQPSTPPNEPPPTTSEDSTIEKQTFPMMLTVEQMGSSSYDMPHTELTNFPSLRPEVSGQNIPARPVLRRAFSQINLQEFRHDIF